MRTLTRFLAVLIALTAISSLLKGDDLVVAPDEAPRYELSKLRMEADRFGRALLVCDYRLIKKGTMGTRIISLGGKTKNGGELTGFGIFNLDDSGQLRFSMHGIMEGGSDFEIYLVINAGFDKQYMISNADRTVKRTRSQSVIRHFSGDRKPVQIGIRTANDPNLPVASVSRYHEF